MRIMESFPKKLKSYNLPTVFAACLLGLTALFLLRFAFPRPPQEPKLARVVIPEGFTVPQISELLSQAGVLSGASLSTDLEGYLFPDTYEFFIGSSVKMVLRRFVENFDSKVLPLVSEGRNLDDAIKVASIIEREVPHPADRRIVAGIIWKRLRSNYPLQVDAAFCYILPSPCVLTRVALAIDSPYNTYTNKGLPPTPISNPGLDAIDAALNPKSSPYWFYISTKSGKTVFAVDLDEHQSNIVKYLK